MYILGIALLIYGLFWAAQEAMAQEATPTAEVVEAIEKQVEQRVEEVIDEAVEEVNDGEASVEELSFFAKARAIMSNDTSEIASVVSKDLADGFAKLEQDRAELEAKVLTAEQAMAAAQEEQDRAEAAKEQYRTKIQSLAACVQAATE